MAKSTHDWQPFEEKMRQRGYSRIAGVDEAGRGPLAGPVVAAAVILPSGTVFPGMRDSRKLSQHRIEAMYTLITESAESWAVGIVSAEEIDRTNIRTAVLKAMTLALQGLPQAADAVLVDGVDRVPFDGKVPDEQIAIVGGDDRALSVAAASIIAKVTRDRMLLELDRVYPSYGFAKHKGYGTAAHIAALKEYGPCPQHRMSFLTRILP